MENGTAEGLISGLFIQDDFNLVSVIAIFVIALLGLFVIVISILLVIRGYKKSEDQTETRLDRVFKKPITFIQPRPRLEITWSVILTIYVLEWVFFFLSRV